jgi:3-hydroxyisobutyrate dehydrogenase
MAKERLGFIGLGTMGMPMVRNMLKGGYRVTVWGRTREKLAPALDAGAIWAESPKAVAETSDIVSLCVWDGKAVEEVVFGPNGIAAGATKDKLLVDHSTIHPEDARALAARLLAQTGMHWVDAPVSGGNTGAEAGTLVVMAGGRDEDIDRYRPAIATTSQRITPMGPVGSGQATKVMNQMLIAAEVAVIAEALGFASKYGLTCKNLPDALKGGWADSVVLQDHARRMIAAKYPNQGTQVLMLKDIGIAQEMGKKVGADMPVTDLVAGLYRKLQAQGDGGKGQIGLMWLYAQQPL